MSATASHCCDAIGSVSSSTAPRPPASMNRPGACPRRRAIRSGKPSARTAAGADRRGGLAACKPAPSGRRDRAWRGARCPLSDAEAREALVEIGGAAAEIALAQDAPRCRPPAAPVRFRRHATPSAQGAAATASRRARCPVASARLPPSARRSPTSTFARRSPWRLARRLQPAQVVGRLRAPTRKIEREAGEVGILDLRRGRGRKARASRLRARAGNRRPDPSGPRGRAAGRHWRQPAAWSPGAKRRATDQTAARARSPHPRRRARLRW